MKKIICWVLFYCIGLNLNAQKVGGCISGIYSAANPKIRLQFEALIENQFSGGVNLSYYFVNWKGPIIEPFARIYGKKNGNVKGFFGQFKMIYGNLSTWQDLYNKGYIRNKRFSTFGVGTGVGYKFLIGKEFAIEPLLGVRFLTPPQNKWASGNAEQEALNILGEGIAWYLTTGFPVDFQLKFGYQF